MSRPHSEILRGARRPGEIRMGQCPLQRPGEIPRIVAGKAKLAAGHQHAGKFCQHLCLNESALVMARLGPGIGKEHENLGDAVARQSAQNGAGIAFMDFEIGDRSNRLDNLLKFFVWRMCRGRLNGRKLFI